MMNTKYIATKPQRRKDTLRNLTFNTVQHLSIKLRVLVPSWQKIYTREF